MYRNLCKYAVVVSLSTTPISRLVGDFRPKWQWQNLRPNFRPKSIKKYTLGTVGENPPGQIIY